MQDIVVSYKCLDDASDQLLQYAKKRMTAERYEKLLGLLASPFPRSIVASMLPVMRQDYAKGKFEPAWWYAFFEKEIDPNEPSIQPTPSTRTIQLPTVSAWSARPKEPQRVSYNAWVDTNVNFTSAAKDRRSYAGRASQGGVYGDGAAVNIDFYDDGPRDGHVRFVYDA